jgi:hypothetical protein
MKHFLEVDNEVILLSNGWIWYYRTSRAGSAENNSKNKCQNFREIIFSKDKFFVW